MKKTLSILILCLSLFSFSQSGNEKLFDTAVQLYNQGKFQESINTYMEIIDDGFHSSSVYFNIGNAYYKLNEVAPSIYYYEKALLLSPKDENIQNNLQFAKNMTIDSIETIPKSAINNLIERTIGVFTSKSWSIFAIFLMASFTISFLIYYFSSYKGKKKLYFIVSIISLILAVTSISAAYHQHLNAKKSNPAIIFAEETIIKSEPNNRSNDIFTLHEGTKVNVIEGLGDWNKIRIADGKTGWIPKNDLRLIKDF
ncbi:tetratricopeptide repeat protein [Zhouia amylolytica]|uniref:tetratricopeptide repeat protein n=1 Tax=Zhouia amylolytica TaxID=376730 RepID=UPI0020CDCD33|nr:tetratricopeptide repeat protein [Zhouia amylolytica]MCQ0110869.1 tetratricopeptide repeat protein [Zhouia amylolytica]